MRASLQGFVRTGSKRHIRSLVSASATPPAVDRVVAAEVFLVGENRLAEFGERQTASPVGLLARSVSSVFAKCAVRRLLPSRRVSVRARAFRAETLSPTHRTAAVGRGSAYARAHSWMYIHVQPTPRAAFPSRRAPSCRKEAPRAVQARLTLAAARPSGHGQAGRSRPSVLAPGTPARPWLPSQAHAR